MQRLLEFLKPRSSAPLTQSTSILDESKRWHTKALLSALCRITPELLIISDKEVLAWDEDFIRITPLTSYAVFNYPGFNSPIGFEHFQAYSDYQIAYLPVNLFCVSVYDVLVEFEYSVSEQALECIRKTLEHYVAPTSTMEKTILELYLQRFREKSGSDASHPLSNQMENVRALILHTLAENLKKPQRFRPVLRVA